MQDKGLTSLVRVVDPVTNLKVDIVLGHHSRTDAASERYHHEQLIKRALHALEAAGFTFEEWLDKWEVA